MQSMRETWGGLSPRKRQLLVLTVVMIIIIAITSPDLTSAITAITVLLGLGAAFLVGRYESEEANEAPAPLAPPNDRESHGTREKFGGRVRPTPVSQAPYVANAGFLPPATDVLGKATDRQGGRAGRSWWPGAIDADEYDTEGAMGHRDRTEGDNDDAPEGNPFVLSRVAAPFAADATVDDEANDGEFDTDEGSVYSALSRNDATRVTAGTMNRRKDLDRYLREEVAVEEDREWWGRHEL